MIPKIINKLFLLLIFRKGGTDENLNDICAEIHGLINLLKVEEFIGCFIFLLVGKAFSSYIQSYYTSHILKN